MKLRRAAAILLFSAAAAGLTSCAPAGDALVDAPDGVRISVYQPRPDVPKNRMAIQVHNDGDGPLTVTSATLDSSFFTDQMVWGPDRTATVPPGYAVDLRVELPTEADCSGVSVVDSSS